MAFFIAGFALLPIVPVYNPLLPTRVKPFKGSYFHRFRAVVPA